MHSAKACQIPAFFSVATHPPFSAAVLGFKPDFAPPGLCFKLCPSGEGMHLGPVRLGLDQTLSLLYQCSPQPQCLLSLVRTLIPTLWLLEPTLSPSNNHLCHYAILSHLHLPGGRYSQWHWKCYLIVINTASSFTKWEGRWLPHQDIVK